ncbi:MarR family transcriptional regulator [Paenibacillus eucommiae]|uniref:DNA-binding MarR family transcriptional regulator n=1 Tax=Paenibacillus eucommiae TaxID=1355755 RepID=A0ABS4IPE0_9BACL|nr:MarR family transcriptional regulator [Paenibacillus eucommiae]MBP1989383.1 DNA-binding MarR family transcriptional regulator [Paenibacillus eucommiae]
MTRSSDPQFNETENIEKEILLKEMMQQVANLQKRFQAEGEDEERSWMITKTSDSRIVEFLRESSVITLHVIDAIGELEPVNGITISKQFGIPRGSVSKITRKLVEQKIIRSEFLPDNKKEVLFHLTSIGQHIYKLHKQLHLHIEQNVRNFLRRYDVDQMQFLVQCMKDTSEASWVETESFEDDSDTAKNAQTAPGISEHASQEGTAIREILSMLQQLDARNLKKAKDLLQVAFFD